MQRYMTDTKRIKKAIDWLKSQELLSSQKELGAMLGIENKSYLSQLVNSSRPNADFLDKFTKLFPLISREWLLTGEGEMLIKQEGNVRMLGVARPGLAEETVSVRFFEIHPSASFQEFCAEALEDSSSVPLIPHAGEKIDDSCCVFDVHGDSMAPQIQNRARVLCREVPPTRWHTLRDCVVAIAYGDYFVIKRIVENHIEADNYIVLASDNPAYPERQTVALCDIRCIFRAMRIVSQAIS